MFKTELCVKANKKQCTRGSKISRSVYKRLERKKNERNLTLMLNRTKSFIGHFILVRGTFLKFYFTGTCSLSQAAFHILMSQKSVHSLMSR